jgi:hypothetical protein
MLGRGDCTLAQPRLRETVSRALAVLVSNNHSLGAVQMPLRAISLCFDAKRRLANGLRQYDPN